MQAGESFVLLAVDNDAEKALQKHKENMGSSPDTLNYSGPPQLKSNKSNMFALWTFKILNWLNFNQDIHTALKMPLKF